jgi:hypothetical protein
MQSLKAPIHSALTVLKQIFTMLRHALRGWLKRLEDLLPVSLPYCLHPGLGGWTCKAHSVSVLRAGQAWCWVWVVDLGWEPRTSGRNLTSQGNCLKLPKLVVAWNILKRHQWSCHLNYQSGFYTCRVGTGSHHSQAAPSEHARRWDLTSALVILVLFCRCLKHLAGCWVSKSFMSGGCSQGLWNSNLGMMSFRWIGWLCPTSPTWATRINPLPSYSILQWAIAAGWNGNLKKERTKI